MLHAPIDSHLSSFETLLLTSPNGKHLDSDSDSCPDSNHKNNIHPLKSSPQHPSFLGSIMCIVTTHALVDGIERDDVEVEEER